MQHQREALSGIGVNETTVPAAADAPSASFAEFSTTITRGHLPPKGRYQATLVTGLARDRSTEERSALSAAGHRDVENRDQRPRARNDKADFCLMQCVRGPDEREVQD